MSKMQEYFHGIVFIISAILKSQKDCYSGDFNINLNNSYCENYLLK